MLALSLLVLFLCGMLFLFALPTSLWLELRRAFAGRRTVVCPENSKIVEVEIDANRAATSTLAGKQQVSIKNCSRWPWRLDCPQDCVPQAVAQNRRDDFTIDHVSVILAGLISWAAVGALRYSPIAREWMAQAGYPRTQFIDRMHLVTPALICGVGSVLAAYVLVWLMRHTNQAGVSRGITIALVLWFGVLGVRLPELAFQLTPGIFFIDALFTLVSLLVAGALIGGLVLHRRHPATVVL